MTVLKGGVSGASSATNSAADGGFMVVAVGASYTSRSVYPLA